MNFWSNWSFTFIDHSDIWGPRYILLFQSRYTYKSYLYFNLQNVHFQWGWDINYNYMFFMKLGRKLSDQFLCKGHKSAQLSMLHSHINEVCIYIYIYIHVIFHLALKIMKNMRLISHSLFKFTCCILRYRHNDWPIDIFYFILLSFTHSKVTNHQDKA